MKKKTKILLTACLVLLSCMIMLTACDSGNESATPNDTTDSTNHSHVSTDGDNVSETDIPNDTTDSTNDSDVSTDGDNASETDIPNDTTDSTNDGDFDADDETAPVVTTVTRDEWKNAFDLSKYGNFVFAIDELLGERDDVWEIKGTIEVKDGTIYYDVIQIENGEEEKINTSAEGEITSLRDLDQMGILGCILYAFEESASYGYTMFEYKEDSKSYYTNKVDMDGTPSNINIWFEDGKIVKITCKGYDDSQEMDTTYSFSFDSVSK